MSSNWPWPTVHYKSPCVDIDVMGAEVADRQDRVDGFRTEDYRLKRLGIIGAGGLGGPIASGAVRKGIGHIDIIDDDTVELTNLSRQYFSEDDLFQPKALRLARNVASMGCLGTRCVGHYTCFNEESIPWFDGFDAMVVGVDNNRARATASRFCRARGIPAVFVAADDSANYLWTFVQKPEGPCLACIFPRVAVGDDDRQRCRPVASIIDTCLVAAGLVLFALDSVLLNRQSAWNFRSLQFYGGLPDVIDCATVRANCRLCGGGQSRVHAE